MQGLDCPQPLQQFLFWETFVYLLVTWFLTSIFSTGLLFLYSRDQSFLCSSYQRQLIYHFSLIDLSITIFLQFIQDLISLDLFWSFQLLERFFLSWNIFLIVERNFLWIIFDRNYLFTIFLELKWNRKEKG